MEGANNAGRIGDVVTNSLFLRTNDWKWWTRFACLFWLGVVLTNIISLLIITLGGITAISYWGAWMGIGFLYFSHGTIALWQSRLITTTRHVALSPKSAISHWIRANYVFFVLTTSLFTAVNVVSLFSLMSSPSVAPLLAFAEPMGLIQINTSTLAMCLFGLFTGGLCSIVYLADNNHVIVFPSIQQTRGTRMLRRVLPILRYSAVVPSAAFILLIICTYTISSVSHRFISTNEGSVHPQHSLTHTLLSQPNWFYVYLYVALFILVGTFRFTCHILEVFFTKPFSLDWPQYFPSRHSHLLVALTTTDHLLKHHAFLDLYRLARFSPERRKAIFADVKGQAWMEVYTASRTQIDKLLDHLKEAVKEGTNKAPHAQYGGIRGFAELLSQLILPVRYRTMLHYLYTTLLGNGQQSQQQATTLPQQPQQPIKILSSHAKVFSLQPSMKVSQQPPEETKPRQAWHEVPVSKAWELLYNKMTGSPSATQLADYHYSNLQLATWAMHAISLLSASAKTEDKMGVILNSNTLPILLCTLIECVAANDEYIRIYPLRAPGISQRIMQWPIVKVFALAWVNRRRDGTRVIDENLGALSDTPAQHYYALADDLSSCIYLLVSTYYENIAYFKFPSKIAAKIQAYADFKE